MLTLHLKKLPTVGNLQLGSVTGTIEVTDPNKIQRCWYAQQMTRDVATKGYVDGAIDSEGIVLGLDITGLGYDAVQGGGATF